MARGKRGSGPKGKRLSFQVDRMIHKFSKIAVVKQEKPDVDQQQPSSSRFNEDDPEIDMRSIGESIARDIKNIVPYVSRVPKKKSGPRPRRVGDLRILHDFYVGHSRLPGWKELSELADQAGMDIGDAYSVAKRYSPMSTLNRVPDNMEEWFRTFVFLHHSAPPPHVDLNAYFELHVTPTEEELEQLATLTTYSLKEIKLYLTAFRRRNGVHLPTLGQTRRFEGVLNGLVAQEHARTIRDEMAFAVADADVPLALATQRMTMDEEDPHVTAVVNVISGDVPIVLPVHDEERNGLLGNAQKGRAPVSEPEFSTPRRKRFGDSASYPISSVNLAKLESYFAKVPSPSKKALGQLAKRLKINMPIVQRWFVARRHEQTKNSSEA